MSNYRLCKKLAVAALAGCMLLTGCSSKKVEEMRLKGIEELEKAKYRDAIETLNEALELSDGKVTEVQFDILMYRAEAEYMSGDVDAAQKTIDTLRKVNGDKDTYLKFQTQLDAKKLVADATKALNADDTETAGEKIEAAKAAGIANDRDLLFNEFVYYEKTAQWQKAFDTVEAYLKQYPGDKDAEREHEFLKKRVEALNNNPALASMINAEQ